MFWRDDGKVSLSYLLLGVIAAGVIALAAWLILVFFAPDRRVSSNAPEKPSAAEEVAEQPVSERYNQALTELRAEIAKTTESAAAIEQAEKSFFSVRVPVSLLDAHLSAVLKIRQLKTSLKPEEARLAITSIISELLAKNAAQK